MIKHYIKIAIRNLVKQKGLAFINLAGLSIGLACFILFLLYTINEFSFDRFHANAANIFRIYRWTGAMNGEEAHRDSYMPMPMGPAMKQEFPDVENYVRIKEAWGKNFIKAEGKTSREEVVYADPQVMDVFSFKLKAGDLKNPLGDPHNVVLTEETVKRLFGQTNPIGKRLEIKVDDIFEPFVVSAIAENLPVNSSIQFKLLGSFHYFENSEGGKWAKDSWTRSGFQTYV
ncbi:MAG TPA: ABC transporter permease, partial [Chitinophagaceae bacterium]|nr:ABC transporter permease [Chitinophagaceae bacterium]